jgi:hypothetical protein
VDTPGGDHVAAIAADIDSFAKATGGVAHTSAIATKITMASLARLNRDGLFEATVLRLQLLQARLADVAIHIDYEDAGRPTRGDADVGVWPSFPPVFDDRSVSGSVPDAVSGARMLAWVLTIRTCPARTLSFNDCVQRQHAPAVTGEAKGLVSF